MKKAADDHAASGKGSDEVRAKRRAFWGRDVVADDTGTDACVTTAIVHTRENIVKVGRPVTQPWRLTYTLLGYII